MKTRRKEYTVETIVEEMIRLVKVYALDEFLPMVNTRARSDVQIQMIQLQYKNIQDQISLYREQLRRVLAVLSLQDIVRRRGQGGRDCAEAESSASIV